jgi:serine/threonine protein kinase
MDRLLEPIGAVGPYDLHMALGTGSFATVWLARHRITGVLVAIKIVMRTSLETDEARTRFTREISLLKQMNHPFIAELFEVIEDSTRYYIVMELVEHGNMLDYVNIHGRLSEDQARRYFCELISALDYLHSSRFVAHRDLKAENVLLDRHGNIRLIDFGLSKGFSKVEPSLLTACGSPAYAAPEMIQGFPYTKAADMWSAGILLYAMVAGHLPFDDDNVQNLLQKVVTTEPDYTGTMSRSLVDLLRRLLCKSPEGRITIDRLKEHPWFSQCEYSVLIGFHTKTGYGDALQVIDRELVERMIGFGIDCRELPHDLLSGEYSSLTSIYKQLRRNKLTDQMKDLLEGMKKLANPAFGFPLMSLSPEGFTADDGRLGQRGRGSLSLMANARLVHTSAAGLLDTTVGMAPVALPLPRPEPARGGRRMSRPVTLRYREPN